MTSSPPAPYRAPLPSRAAAIVAVMVGIALFSGMEFNTPAGHLLLRTNGDNAWFGWPNSEKLEALRDQWFDAPDMAAQKTIGRQIQAQFFEDVPYIPLGQYFVDSAYRKGLTDIRRGIPLPLNVRRG